MRIFKFIFGRFFIIFLLTGLQVMLFVSLFTFIKDVLPYYFFANVVVTALAVLIVVRLINRRVNPNYIIPWIVVVLLLPLTGIVAYLMFSSHRLSRNQKKLYNKIYFSLYEYIPQNEQVKQRLKQTDKLIFSQSEFLSNSSFSPVYNEQENQYFPTGEQFFTELKTQIEKAQRFIFLEFFILENGVMFNSILELLIKKVEQGVEVRLMYDDIGSITTLSTNFYKKMRRLGIKCVKFNRFLPIASAVHNNRDHRKIVIIDGITGFVTGANLADEYINLKKKQPFWKDSAIMIKGEAVRNLTFLFLVSYFAQIKRVEDCSGFFPKINNNQNNLKNDNLGFVLPFGDGPAPLYQEKVSQNTILNMLYHAKKSVYITTPYLIIDFQLTEAIRQVAKRGIDVKIVTPKIPDKQLIFLMTRSNYTTLIEAGVKIYQFTPGFIHSKNILVDDETAIVGTINLDYRSLVHHFECGVWLHKTSSINQIHNDFEDIFSLSEQITLEQSQLKFFPKLLKSILQLFAPLL